MAQTEPKTDNRNVVEVTMSVEEARQVVWQGRGPRKPIGELLDAEIITYRDLGWAVKKAYNPQVREAAWTLLTWAKGQPIAQEVSLSDAAGRYGSEVIEEIAISETKSWTSLQNWQSFLDSSVDLFQCLSCMQFRVLYRIYCSCPHKESIFR